MNKPEYKGFAPLTDGTKKVYINGEWITGEWIDGYPLYKDDLLIFMHFNQHLGGLWEPRYIIPETLSVFTGKILCGEKLYTNDICCTTEDYDDGWGYTKTSDFHSVVVYDEENFCFSFETEGYRQCLNDWDWDNCYPVSNIFENPDLISSVNFIFNHYMKEEYVPVRTISFSLKKEYVRKYLEEIKDERDYASFVKQCSSEDVENLYCYACTDKEILNENISYSITVQIAFEEFKSKNEEQISIDDFYLSYFMKNHKCSSE